MRSGKESRGEFRSRCDGLGVCLVKLEMLEGWEVYVSCVCMVLKTNCSIIILLTLVVVTPTHLVTSSHFTPNNTHDGYLQATTDAFQNVKVNGPYSAKYTMAALKISHEGHTKFNPCRSTDRRTKSTSSIPLATP